MSAQISPIRKAWYRWKALKLPWRKRFLVGLDLQGNTYWEFKDAITANRMRRIVQYPSSTHHSDLNITPQWHQWLRHTRSDPPSLTEQSQDVVRLEDLKVLAARADARWAAKESYLDVPPTAPAQALPPTAWDVRSGGDVNSDLLGQLDREDSAPPPPPNSIAGKREPGEVKLVQQEAEAVETEKGSRIKEQVDKKDPWKLARGGPSEDWQPSTWGGDATSRK